MRIICQTCAGRGEIIRSVMFARRGEGGSAAQLQECRVCHGVGWLDPTTGKPADKPER